MILPPPNHNEMPHGFIKKSLPQVGALLPLPWNWFYQARQVDGNFLFLLTADSINTQGFFQTGVSLNVFPQANQQFGASAVEIAEGMIDSKPLKLLEALSEAERQQDENFVAVRRHFGFPGYSVLPVPSLNGEFRSHAIPPTHVYIETRANPETDTLYVLRFEAPEKHWPDYKPTADIMINHAQFNPDF